MGKLEYDLWTVSMPVFWCDIVFYKMLPKLGKCTKDLPILFLVTPCDSKYHNKNFSKRMETGPVTPRLGPQMRSKKLPELKYPKVLVWVIGTLISSLAISFSSSPLLTVHFFSETDFLSTPPSLACSSLRTFAHAVLLPKNICFPSLHGL